MHAGAKAVKTLPGFRLLITFENGEQRVFDVSPIWITASFVI